MLRLNQLHSAEPTAKESEVNQRVVPYTTSTGLQIGCMYQPKQKLTISRDMELLQTALLAQGGYRPNLWSRVRTALLRRWGADQ